MGRREIIYNDIRWNRRFSINNDAVSLEQDRVEEIFCVFFAFNAAIYSARYPDCKKSDLYSHQLSEDFASYCANVVQVGVIQFQRGLLFKPSLHLAFFTISFMVEWHRICACLL